MALPAKHRLLSGGRESLARPLGHFEAALALMDEQPRSIGGAGRETAIGRARWRRVRVSNIAQKSPGAAMSTRELFLGARFAEGCRDFLLLYARPWVAALPEILLFGAVTHHAGISNLGSLLGLARGFLRHAKYSVGCPMGRWELDACRLSG